jgi:hypothetical protein
MAANRDRSGKKITIGKAKAIAKVQKGLDKTSNRVPTLNARAGITPEGKIKITENGFTGVSGGSNKDAAKGNAPKNTPGVKKNTSLQRSINNSNNNLKDLKKPAKSGGMGRGSGVRSSFTGSSSGKVGITYTK